MIRVTNLVKFHGQTPVLNGATLEVAKGQVVHAAPSNEVLRQRLRNPSALPA